MISIKNWQASIEEFTKLQIYLSQFDVKAIEQKEQK